MLPIVPKNDLIITKSTGDWYSLTGRFGGHQFDYFFVESADVVVQQTSERKFFRQDGHGFLRVKDGQQSVLAAALSVFNDQFTQG